MKKDHAKNALKLYQKNGGILTTQALVSVKKESDLATVYYPGILGVVEKIEKNPANIKKYSRYHRSFGIVSTRSPKYYPLLSAKAALLSSILDANIIPILVRYKNLKGLPDFLDQISPSFQGIFCTDLNSKESNIIESYRSHKFPIILQSESEAAAILAAIMNACKMMGKTLRKANITIEGTDKMIKKLIILLLGENAENLRLVDERGLIYRKRPNMNKSKIELVKLLKAKKEDITREETLNMTDIYVYSSSDDLTHKTTELLPKKAAIVCLQSESIEKTPKQAVISTLPTMANHITDLHIVAGVFQALIDGKKYSDSTIPQATKALSSIYKAPKADRLIPGLLEKNLAKKISKGIK